MITRHHSHNAQSVSGFSIVSAIFILVILSLTGTFAIKIISRLSAGNAMSIDGVRAYYAAKSGLQWGIFKVVANPAACPATTTLTYTQVGLINFQAVVSCTATSFTEGASTYNVFKLTAVGSRGATTDYDYVTRTLILSLTASAP